MATTHPSAAAENVPAPAGRKRPKKASEEGRIRSLALSFATWALGLIFFFPIIWMAVISFRSERDAATSPPKILASFTLSSYRHAWDGGIKTPLLHSLIVSVATTIVVLLLAVPAAYALSIKPVRKWTDALFFFLSTRMMPAAASLLAVFLLARNLHLLDHLYTIVMFATVANVPIAIWMIRSFLLEVPREMIEAAEVDGARLHTVLFRVIGPVITPGLAATALICFIFTWNEFLFALSLASTNAVTATFFLAGSVAPEGLFLAKLCAVSTMVSLPVLVAGFLAQDKLVRGLSLGAVK